MVVFGNNATFIPVLVIIMVSNTVRFIKGADVAPYNCSHPKIKAE